MTTCNGCGNDDAVPNKEHPYVLPLCETCQQRVREGYCLACGEDIESNWGNGCDACGAPPYDFHAEDYPVKREMKEDPYVDLPCLVQTETRIMSDCCLMCNWISTYNPADTLSADIVQRKGYCEKIQNNVPKLRVPCPIYDRSWKRRTLAMKMEARQ